MVSASCLSIFLLLLFYSYALGLAGSTVALQKNAISKKRRTLEINGDRHPPFRQIFPGRISKRKLQHRPRASLWHPRGNSPGGGNSGGRSLECFYSGSIETTQKQIASFQQVQLVFPEFSYKITHRRCEMNHIPRGIDVRCVTIKFSSDVDKLNNRTGPWTTDIRQGCAAGIMKRLPTNCESRTIELRTANEVLEIPQKTPPPVAPSSKEKDDYYDYEEPLSVRPKPGLNVSTVIIPITETSCYCDGNLCNRMPREEDPSTTSYSPEEVPASAADDTNRDSDELESLGHTDNVSLSSEDSTEETPKVTLTQTVTPSVTNQKQNSKKPPFKCKVKSKDAKRLQLTQWLLPLAMCLAVIVK